MALRDLLHAIVNKSFEVSADAYAEELSDHERELGLHGDQSFSRKIRPKFFTGEPEALEPGSYILALSLNHKATTDSRAIAEVEALNSGPEQHFASCSNYFRGASIYPFYRNFEPVLRGMGVDAARLGADVFFMDALPFFSRRSRSHGADELRRLRGRFIDLNREAVKSVLTSVPPSAILINGKTAFAITSLWSDGAIDWKRHFLENETRAGACWVDLADAELFGVRVKLVRTNFLRSIYGPNSVEQRHELGQIIAHHHTVAARARPPKGQVAAQPRPNRQGYAGDQAEFLDLIGDLLHARTGQPAEDEDCHGRKVHIGDGYWLWVEAVTRRRGYPPAPEGLLLRVRVGADGEARRLRLGQIYAGLEAPENATLHAQHVGEAEQRWIETFWVHGGDMDEDLEIAEALVDWWLARVRGHGIG